MKKLKASLQITINFLQELLCLYFIVGELKVFTCSSAVLCLALGTVTWTLDKRFPFDLIANNANIFSTARTQTVHSTFIHIYWRRKVGFLYQLFSNDSPISGHWSLSTFYFPENRGYRKRPVPRNGLIICIYKYIYENNIKSEQLKVLLNFYLKRYYKDSTTDVFIEIL